MTKFLSVAVSFYIAMTSHSAVRVVEAARIPHLRRAGEASSQNRRDEAADEPLCIIEEGGCLSTGLEVPPCCNGLQCIEGTCSTNPDQPTPGSSPPVLTSPPGDTPAPTPAPTKMPAGATKTDRTYFFASDQIFNWSYRSYGNAVPHFFRAFSAAANVTSLMDGERREFKDDPIPPNPQWSLDMSAWNGTFNSSKYDSIVYTDYNDIQDFLPTHPYSSKMCGSIGPHDCKGSPLDRLLKIVDYVSENDPTTVIYLYESWREISPFFNDGKKKIAYYDSTWEAEKLTFYESMNASSSYHQWWVDLHSNVTALRNTTDIRLVPVAPILASVLSSEYMINVKVYELFNSKDGSDLYDVSSPTVYFIAALILYMAKYEQRPSSSYVLPSNETLHQDFLDNYDAIVYLIYHELYPPVSPPISPPIFPPTDPPVSLPVSSPVSPPVSFPVSSPVSPPVLPGGA